MSANEYLTVGEQSWDPRYHVGLDDHGRYLLHPPYGYPAAANRFPPIQYNPPLSQMDDGSSTAEFSDFDQYSFSGLSRNTLEGGPSSLTEGHSPPSPSKPSHYSNDLSLPMEALRSSPALPSFANAHVSRPHLSPWHDNH
jgi:hypothetical protein